MLAGNNVSSPVGTPITGNQAHRRNYIINVNQGTMITRLRQRGKQSALYQTPHTLQITPPARTIDHGQTEIDNMHPVTPPCFKHSLLSSQLGLTVGCFGITKKALVHTLLAWFRHGLDAGQKNKRPNASEARCLHKIAGTFKIHSPMLG